MKATGVVRKLDELGRIVIPREIINNNGWSIGKKGAGTALEIYVDGPRVILGKYEPGCIFCGDVGGLKEYKGKMVCSRCRKEIK